MRDIEWRESDNRYGTPVDQDIPPMQLTYTGKGPRWWGKVENGKLYIGKSDA